jgi:integrase
LLDVLGIPRCGFHAFRHALSSLLVSEGVPISVAQAQLRHTDARMTLDVYSHAIGTQHRQAIDGIADKMLPSVTKPSGQVSLNQLVN